MDETIRQIVEALRDYHEWTEEYLQAVQDQNSSPTRAYYAHVMRAKKRTEVLTMLYKLESDKLVPYEALRERAIQHKNGVDSTLVATTPISIVVDLSNVGLI